MSKNSRQIWLTAIGVAAFLVIALVAGIVIFVNLTERPLHPNPQDVKAVTRSAPPSQWVKAVEESSRIVRAALFEQNLPGVSIAVGVQGDIIWAEGVGWADLQKQVQVTPETRFRIGHTSVALTSAAVGLLLEKRKLQLDDEIQRYVPAFPEKKWPVTLRQLMGHVAGVRHYKDTEWGDDPHAHCERAAEGLRTFANDPLLFEPQTEYRYSTYGWVLVSAAVEAAAGDPFFTFMRAQIFQPLGMSSTTPDAPAESIPDRATPYYKDRFNNVQVAADVDYTCFAGAGAFLSTPSDLVRFGMAIGSGALLQPATVKELQTPQQLASGKDTDYGLGWTLETIPLAGEPTRVASHSGRILLGGSTSFLIFPERGLVVAVTSNFSLASLRSIALQIAEVFAAAGK